jgi:glycosyltransferase involved in cell wall biosynthesis
MSGDGTQRQLAGTLLAAHGHRWDATLCVLRAGYSLAHQVAEGGVPVVELGASGTSHLRRGLGLRRLIKTGDFDVVHSSLWGCNAVTRLAAAFGGRPAVVISERSVESWRSPAGRRIDRVLRPLTDHYIANSDDVAAFVRDAHGVGPDRLSVIRNGMDRRIFRPAPEPTQHGGAAYEGVARVGCVGRLIRDKAIDVVLAALPLVLEQRSVQVVVAGDGPEREKLETSAHGLPVQFLGYLESPSEMADFLRSLDVFVMASRYEGLPNAVLEAMECGVPVVATNVAGMAEATQGRALLVAPGEPASLADAVLTVLDGTGPAGRGRPGEASILSFDDVATAHLEAFHLALGHRGRARL